MMRAHSSAHDHRRRERHRYRKRRRRASGDAPWQFRWNNDPGLTWAKAEEVSPLGALRSSWNKSNGNVTWSISVPPGSRAEVTFPDLGPLGAQQILENGAAIEAGNCYGTGLHMAAEQGHAVVARLLSEKGADVNTEDEERKTALEKAAGRRQ